MSKKRDDIFLDDDFGMDDFDDTGEGGFESPGKKGGRQPVTSLKGSFIEGVKDGIKDPSIQMKFVRAALPSGYNQTIDFADKVASGVDQLYTDAAKEAAPVIKTLKEFTRKHVSPGMGDMLPKSWKEKLDSWAEEQESNSREVIDPEESEIAMTLGTMFQAQQEAIQKIDQAQQEREVEREGRQMADANVMQTQTDASLKTLAQIQQNTGRLANYQDQVTINFQRKSLELQYRTYFVNRKLLDVMEQHLDLSKSSFETLVHNSGLPDLLKAHNHEKMVEVMKMKYLGEMTDPMSKWFAGIGTKLIQKGKHDVKDFFQSFGSTLSDMAMGMDSFKEQQEMNREMGEREESMGEFGAKMMGSMAADKGSEWAGKLFGKSDFLRDSWFGQFLEKTGFMLERLNRDKAYMYQDFVNNGEMNGGFLGNIARWFKEGSGTYSRDDRVLSNSADELDKQVYWSLQNSRTLNEVIPGLLTTINQSIIDGNNVRKAGSSKDVLAKATAMTKEGGGKIHYSFESNRFETETDILERVKKELNKPDRDKGLAEALTDVVNAIDEDYDLSEEIRNGIRAYVIELAANAVEMPRVDRWLVEAGENFPEQLRGKTTNLTNDEDDHLGARGSWVKAISDVVKSTFGYKERVEWKDDKPIGKFSEAFQIFNRQPALNKLSIRYANLVSKLESNKEALIKFSKQGFGYQEVLRQNKYLVREQEKYKDAFGVEKSKDKSDAFDWRENIEGRNKNILNISRDDAETRAEKDYERALEAYNTAKEAYDEGLRTGMVAPGTAAPVEPTKPPHMRAAGGIIPDDGIDRFQLGGKKGKGSKKSQVKWKRQNGYVAGQGTGTSDEIPSYLSNGEYVVRAASVKRPGVMQLLRYINSLGDDDSVWGSSGVGESGDGFALNEAILAAGDKTEAQLVEVNNRLQKLIDKPFVALNFGDLTGPDLEKFKEMFGNMGTGMLSASDKLLLKGKEGVSKASSWLWDKAKWGADKTWGGITGTAKFGWDVVSGAAKGTKKIFNDWMEDARDIMVRGSNEVRIRADDIRNRLLYDVNTNEIIKSIKDITGEVRRIDTDEIVLSLEDFRKRLTDQRFKPMLTWVSKKYDQAKNIVFAPFRLVKSIAGHIGNILDMTDDIYVKGSEPWKPRMFVNVARAGKYIDAKSNKTINYVSDIKGAVLLLKDDGSEPTMVITEDEFNKGLLCDRAGNPLKGLREKVYNSIKKAGSFLIDVAKKGLEKARDFGGWVWDKLSGGWDGFKSWFDGTGTIQLGLFTTQTATVTRLEQIWMLLNDRLPGEKASVPSDYGKMAELRLPNLGENFKSAEAWFERKKAHIEAKSAIAKAKALAKAEEAKAKLEQLKAEAILKAERARMAKDRIVTSVNAKYGDKMSPFWKRLLGVDKATANQNHFTEWAKAGGFNDNDLKDPEMRGLVEDEYRKAHPDQGFSWNKVSLEKVKGWSKDIFSKDNFNKEKLSGKLSGAIVSLNNKLFGNKTQSDVPPKMSLDEFITFAENRSKQTVDRNNEASMRIMRKAYDQYVDMYDKEAARQTTAAPTGNVKDNLKSLFNNGTSYLKERGDALAKRKDEWLQVANERSNNILDMLPAFKPKTFAEWLDSYEISGNDFDKLSPNDRALVETQYKVYVQSVAAKRDELKGKIGFAKTGVMGKFEKIRSFFGKDEDGKSFKDRMNDLKGKIDTFSSDIKTGEWRNKLATKRDSLKEGAKGWLETGKGLKDSVLGAGGSVRDKFKNLIRRRPNADDFVGPVQPMAQAMTFAKFLDSKGINEQEFDYLPDREKEALNKEFQDHHAARGRQIPNLRPDAPKQSLFGKIKGWGGKLKVSNPFKRGQSADADGDGDRDGSAADQRQQREAAEEKSMMKKFFSGIAGAAKGGWEAGKGKGGIGMLTGLVGLVPKLFTGIAGGIGLVMKAAKGLLTLNVGKAMGAIMKPVGMAAKAAFGAGSMVLRAGVAAATYGAAILTSPVTLAAGATAVAAYMGYSWFKKKMQNNDVLFRFRMLQYGFKHDDETNVSKILQTEKALQPIVKFDQQGLASLTSGMKAETLMAIWGIDTSDSKEVERWIVWFSGRFKPIYLSHCTTAKVLAKTHDLTKIDNLNTDDSLKYIKAVHFAGEGRRPYDIMASPVAGGDDLDVAGDAWFSHSVDNEFDDAVEWLEDNRKEIDLESQAASDPNKAKELEDMKNQKWQAKTKQLWQNTKDGVKAGIDGAKEWLWNKPIEGWKLIGQGTVDLAKGAVDAAAQGYDAASAKASKTWNSLTGSKRDNFMKVLRAAEKAGDPHPAIVAAQWALESGWGKSESGKFNYFGIKARKGEPGTVRRTREVRNGRDVMEDHKFTDYPSLEAGIQGRVNFINENARYRKAGYYSAKTPYEAALALVRGQYATDPKYATLLSSILKNVGIDASKEYKSGMTQPSMPAQTVAASTPTPAKIDPTKSKEGTVPSQGVAVGNMPPPPKTASTTPAKIDPTKTSAAPAVSASPTPTTASSPATENAKPTATANMKENLTKPAQFVSLQAPIAKPDTAVTREGTEDVSVRPANEPANTPVVSAAPITADPRAVASEGVIPVDVMAEKQKAEKEAALIAAEKRRQDALDTTSTGMDASVAILKEQLRIAISMDNSLSKIEQHLAKMATMSKQQPASAAPAEKSSSQDMRMMTSGSPDNTPAPVSVSRRT